MNDKDRINQIAALGCIICGGPANLHHLRTGVGMGQRGRDVLPLCQKHHQHGGFGVAYHAGAREFEKNFGTELELLEKVNKLLEVRYGI